jgi:Metallo-peptidase family M12
MNPTHPPFALWPVALWRVVLWRCRAALTIAVCVLVASMLAPRSRAEPIALTPDQLAIIDSIAKPQGGNTVGYAGAPTDPIGAEVRLPFGEGKFITLRRKGSTLREDGSISWYGEVAETGERALLMVWDKALLTGYFAYKGTVFAVESLGGGVHAFAELNRGQQLPDHPDPVARPDNVPTADRNGTTKPPSVPVEPSVPGLTDTDRKALEAKNITIDVMILYTQNVAKRYIRDPADLLALAVDEANQSFKGSGLGNIRLRLVYTEAVDYDTTVDDQFTHLYAMVDGLGPFKGVRKLRDDKRADIVGLIIDNPKGCGLSTRVRPDSDEAFFVVHHACATTTMSIAHEIGHVLGIRHDRFVDQSNTPFAYGHGYVNGTKWRDIMSYNEGCGGCPRIPYWSNPRIMYKGEPTGTDAADSARVILELAERVSKFR